MDNTPLRDPRRIGVALLLFLLLAGGAGGLLGMASAQDGEADPAAGALRLAAPRLGDHGTYRIQEVALERPGQSLDDARPRVPASTLTFEQRGRQATVDAAGAPRLVDVLVFDDDSEDAKRHLNDEWHTRLGYHLDADTGEPLALLREWVETEQDTASDGTPTVKHSASWSVYFFDSGVGGYDLLPCGFRTPLQGTTAATTQPGLPLLPCRGGRTSDTLLVPRQVVEKDGEALLALDVVHSDPQRARDGVLGRVWYEEGTPYPVRSERYEHGDLSRAVVAELTRFQAGDAPLVDPADRRPVVPEAAPRTPWMFDETGIEHPFPASEAYRVALADNGTGLADFLEENPEAYIVDASYWEFKRVEAARETYEHEWRLAWRDADSIHHVHIGKRTNTTEAERAGQGAVGYVVGLVTGEPPPSGPASPYYYFDASKRDLERYGAFVPPPERLPTVATLWAYYDAWASPEMREAGPNMWEWTILGSERGPRILLNAGRFQDTPYPADDGDVVYHRDWAFLEYDWAEQDLPFRYSERGRTERTAPAAVATAPQRENAPTLAAVGDLPVWSLPPEQAAAVSLGALLVSLGYYLWPVAKGGLLGLFSRVGDHEVLRHPLRRTIHDHVRAAPGTHHSELVRVVGAGESTVHHHLRKLQAARLVVARRANGYTCYFPVGAVDNRHMDAFSAVKSPVARRLVEALRERPGIRTGELAQHAGAAPSTVSYHLKRLRSTGVVECDGDGHRLTESARRLTLAA